MHSQSGNKQRLKITIAIKIDLVAQLVEQMTLNHWVEGSSPSQVTQTKKEQHVDLVAQLVEQMTLNHWVEGSSPSQVTHFGEMAEWSIAAVLKTVELRGSRGSNPCLSATKGCKSSDYEIYTLFLFPIITMMAD